MSDYQIYCDGGCQPNPGTGAYAIVVTNEHKHICETYCEGRAGTTNNQMELEAMLLALQYAHTHPHMDFEIFTDSKYTFNGLTSWIARWKTHDWLNGQNQPVKNIELWKELDELHSKVRNVKLRWVKGHSDNALNDAVDLLCNAKIRELYGKSPQP